MIDWMARARAQLTQTRQGSNDETDETPISSVSSVAPGRLEPKCGHLSSVLPVHAATVSAPNMAWPTGDFAANDSDTDAPEVELHSSGNPLMTLSQGDECHAGGWDDAEIATFLERAAAFRAFRRADAEHLAERLTLRDRQADERHLCLECRELESSGQCAAARRGAINGVLRRMEPVLTLLVRCQSFSAATPNQPIQEGSDDGQHRD